MKRLLVSKINKFFEVESSSSLLLAASAILGFIFANSLLSAFYFEILNIKLFSLSIQHWINDGLMVIFFFVVGLEIKRELVDGELSTPQKAMLPVICAIGGMILPALIFLFFNRTLPASNGWGIPMATDIAFAIGILTVFGRRVPASLKILLLAIAIVDDLGAILAIAFFYTEQIKPIGLAIAASGLGLVLLLRIIGLRSYVFYILVGIVVWFGFLYSGVHATIAGVILGIMTPVRISKNLNAGNPEVLEYLIHRLHPWVSFLIMPLFAFANAGVDLRESNFSAVILNPIFLGVAFGLVFGKPLGIFISAYLGQILGVVKLPAQLKWADILGVGALAGVGFTMSLFISSLALPENLELFSKVGIIFASIISGTLGFFFLNRILKRL